MTTTPTTPTTPTPPGAASVPPTLPDIASAGATPPPRRRKVKWRYVIALAVCVGAIAFMITSLSENVNYLETVSQAVQHRGSEQNRELRLGGVVVKNTLQRTKDGASFWLGDGKAKAFVHVTNIPSQLFAECAPVVVEGKWNGTSFAGDNLLVRHGATYGASSGKDAKTITDALAGTGCQKPS